MLAIERISSFNRRPPLYLLDLRAGVRSPSPPFICEMAPRSRGFLLPQVRLLLRSLADPWRDGAARPLLTGPGEAQGEAPARGSAGPLSDGGASSGGGPGGGAPESGPRLAWAAGRAQQAEATCAKPLRREVSIDTSALRRGLRQPLRAPQPATEVSRAEMARAPALVGPTIAKGSAELRPLPSLRYQSPLVRHLQAMIRFGGGPLSVAEYMQHVLTSPAAGAC